MGNLGKSNEELYDDALEAITTLFSDQSVSRSRARENLKSLMGEIEIMLATLEDEEE